MNRTTPPELVVLRKEIDAVDRALLQSLAERQALVEQVIAIKQKAGLPARIPERVADVIARLKADAAETRASPALVETVWTAMIEWFIAHEEKSLGGK